MVWAARCVTEMLGYACWRGGPDVPGGLIRLFDGHAWSSPVS
jgi:hypothetical protein